MGRFSKWKNRSELMRGAQTVLPDHKVAIKWNSTTWEMGTMARKRTSALHYWCILFQQKLKTSSKKTRVMVKEQTRFCVDVFCAALAAKQQQATRAHDVGVEQKPSFPPSTWLCRKQFSTRRRLLHGRNRRAAACTAAAAAAAAAESGGSGKGGGVCCCCHERARSSFFHCTIDVQPCENISF